MKAFTVQGKKILCAIRNFRGVGASPSPAGDTVPAPQFFLKPTTAYVAEPNPIYLPRGEPVDYELELGIVIGKAGRHIEAAQATYHIGGYVLALDLCATNVQRAAQRHGLPWAMAKGWDTACPVSAYIPRIALKNPYEHTYWVRKNGVLEQSGTLAAMATRIPELLAAASRSMTLEDGDLVLTGTPFAKGSLRPGDRITAGIDQDLMKMHFNVYEAQL